MRADPESIATDKARTIAMLTAVTLRAMDASDSYVRMEAVERVLKMRKDR